MKNIFVTGGTGFVGTVLCEKLARQGFFITVATRRRRHAQSILHLPRLTVLELNVHDEAALTQALAGHDAVVNLVARLHGTQAEFEQTHVALPKKLAHACVKAGVKQVVHVSALGADALQPERAPSMYLRSKGEGEAVLIQAATGAGADLSVHNGFDLSILRPSVIFGAGDKFLNRFASLQQFLPVMPLAGAQVRFQPVWVEDVASAVVRCLAGATRSMDSPRIIEAYGPKVFTLRQLVRLAAQLGGVANGSGRPVIGLPDWAGRLQAVMLGLAPGEPLMSADNLDSMKIDNVASFRHPGLEVLGVTAADLVSIARGYLGRR